MKKLCRKGTVHPSPPIINDHLAFLPATILTLTAALTPEDREVLAYLISCSGSSGNFPGSRKNTQKGSCGGSDHPPMFNCCCFRCYMSYWVRWDSSPNRQLIHEIIDAFEDGLVQSKSSKNKRERRKRGSSGSDDLKRPELRSSRDELGESDPIQETAAACNGGGDGETCGDEDEEMERGSVRKLVSFIGERIWSVWGQ